MIDYEVINILDMIDSVGEDEVKAILSKFSCSKNKEIENFVRNNAVEFAKKKMSITYLVYSKNGSLAAIFTLTHKALTVRNDILSNTMRKKIQRYSRLDLNTDSFTMSAFLIAQFGKNDNLRREETINGNELMDFTFKILNSIQYDIGGGLVYLECENKDKLLNFYSSEPNLFRKFGERYSETDGITYVQLFRFL